MTRNSNSNSNSNNYNYSVRSVAIATVGLQLILLGSLPPTASGLFFRDRSLLSVIGKIDKSVRANERKSLFRSGRENSGACPPQQQQQQQQQLHESDPSRSNHRHHNRDNNDDEEEEEEEEEGLVFEGTFDYQSDIVPLSTAALSSPADKDHLFDFFSDPRNRDHLFDFFSDPRNRDLVIKGGGNHCERIPLTPTLHEQWTSQSRIVRSTPPEGTGGGGGGGDNETNNTFGWNRTPNRNFNTNRNTNTNTNRNEEILAVYSEVPIVPGLSLRAVSYTGCKTMRDSVSALPYYEFTLLKETYQPVGKKAMTWIFDKVTGNSNSNHNNNNSNKSGKRNEPSSNMEEEGMGSGTEQRHDPGEPVDGSPESRRGDRKTYALSRVTLKPFPGDGGCKICYYGHVKLTLSKKFLHVLPLPVGIVRTKVNKSIQKQLERECTRSMEKFTRALHQWNERSNNNSNSNSIAR